MRLKRRLALAAMGFALPVVIFGFGQLAQCGSAREAAPPVFNALFPKPTGKNGYEDFARAEDLFTSSPAFAESERLYGEQSAVSINAKRKLISDPTAQQVLGVLRTGFNKRIRSPRPAPQLNTLIPELRDFRAIARLMCAEMDVRFADGKMSEAVDCLNDALTFGRDVQAGTLMSGVVGLYIENTALDDFTGHVGVLSASDCDKLAHVAGWQLEHSDREVGLVNSERDMFLRTFRNNREDASALLDKLDPGPNVTKSVRRDFTQMCRVVKEDPAAGTAMLDRAADLVTVHFAGVLEEINRPVWERNFSEPTESASAESRMVFSLFPPDYTQLSDRFAGEQLRVRMLAVEARAVGYLRRSGHTPEDLKKLIPTGLIIDSFSGKPLGYERKGTDSFTISSVGPYNTRSSKGASAKSRVPMLVVFPPQ